MIVILSVVVVTLVIITLCIRYKNPRFLSNFGNGCFIGSIAAFFFELTSNSNQDVLVYLALIFVAGIISKLAAVYLGRLQIKKG
ncbi:hypothetical protein NMR92_001254 [Vibrio cholerae]|uniref:Uncharacterized protein n=2 Tax=Vibrio TaxID=662 RepID=A0A1B1LRQ4_VIBPH|nr:MULTISPECIES: hypothetical protein [Vibrio]ANS55733.1 hypothetical protein [Vibrio parahaemolyticus]EJL6460802.1 hypothetical protein [Vibrio cholerae]EJL6490354.1 hypothetical protein [Vibrio cholerae]EJL6642044.1 hypothetical protein [Vibrio cholerae]MBJ6954138.1 hypothetical protein [Vibrio cholerae]